MTSQSSSTKAAGPEARRLFVFNGGFLTQPRIRRILELAGYEVKLGAPGPTDAVGVWGKSPTSPRGEAVADFLERDIIRVEDPFLRSVHLGREGAAPLGLLIDSKGAHFSSDKPSDLERLLATHPLDDGALLERARVGMARLRASKLSKYNLHDPDRSPPPPGYVLVIDQTKGDASIAEGGSTASTFREMLVFAQTEHPGARVVIKAHPETVAGHRKGHYEHDLASDRISFAEADLCPWALFEGAVGVYTVSSQLGFEAILAGHKPRVFGQPFYSGWGLTADENPVPRRERRLTRAQLFSAAMILYPSWYDPCRDRLCTFEEALDQLEAEVRAFRDDRKGHVATGIRLWKRRHLQRALGREKPVIFKKNRAEAEAAAGETGRDLLVWGQDEASMGKIVVRHLEDGCLRSRGLGAELTAPLSFVADRAGIYYDPTRKSDLEAMILAGPPPGGERRAERLIRSIARTGISKYNVGTDTVPELPAGHRILVVGQVEDDASVLLGASDIRTNRDLLEAARRARPDAVLLYKPHPDVEAGLRPGQIAKADLAGKADVVLAGVSADKAIEVADEIWTITSTLGFEALLRGKPVTCLGTPFYAGWGLTRDLGAVPARRTARPSLAALAHACLIAYPRYVDPQSDLPCPPEVAVERLSSARLPRRSVAYRGLAKLQGIFASQSWLWR